MNRTVETPGTAPRLERPLGRRLATSLVLLAACGALQQVVAWSGLTEGLVTPEGRISVVTALVLLTLLGLRLVALFVALPTIAFHLARAALTALSGAR